jgi:hypothetical protein
MLLSEVISSLDSPETKQQAIYSIYKDKVSYLQESVESFEAKVSVSTSISVHLQLPDTVFYAKMANQDFGHAEAHAHSLLLTLARVMRDVVLAKTAIWEAELNLADAKHQITGVELQVANNLVRVEEGAAEELRLVPAMKKRKMGAVVLKVLQAKGKADSEDDIFLTPSEGSVGLSSTLLTAKLEKLATTSKTR